MRILRITLLMIVAMCSVLHAEDLYIAQTAAGGGTGANCANALAYTFFNTAGNWGAGAGKISAGDTVHLCGTVTSQLVFQASGTAGNVITLKWETGAKMSSPAWSGNPNDSTGGAIVADTLSYLVIDGGTNGIIENTANGTGLANQVDSIGIDCTSCSYTTVQNLAINNLYVRTIGTEQNGYGWGVLNRAHANATYSNFRVTNCTIHDAYNAVDLDYATASTVEIDHNTFYNVNWGGRIGDRQDGSTFSGLKFHDSNVHDFENWDDTSVTNSFHHNGFFGWAVQAGGHSVLQQVDIYNNVIGPNFTATPTGPNHATSGIFFAGYTDQIRVYNNVFLESGVDYPADGLIYLDPYKDTTLTPTLSAYNNTFIGGTAGIGVNLSVGHSGSATQTFNVKNNVGQNLGVMIGVFDNATGTYNIDYNIGYNLTSGQQYSYSSNDSSVFKTFAQWQALGFDTHGGSGNPNLSASYIPQPSSSAIGAGVNLTSLGIAGLNVDAAGVARPASGAWDVGAYNGPPGGGGVAFSGTAAMGGTVVHR